MSNKNEYKFPITPTHLSRSIFKVINYYFTIQSIYIVHSIKLLFNQQEQTHAQHIHSQHTHSNK